MSIGELLHDDPKVHQRRWFLLGIMCLSLVLVVMSVSALNVALPTLQDELGTTATELQWIVASYAIVFAALLLTAGSLGDRYGRKGALLVGLGVFAAGAGVGALANDPAHVIAARAVMGIGAAFVMPSTLSLLVAIFPPSEHRRAIAVWAGFAGAGGAIGPLVSGALLESFWWGSSLLINLPAAAFVAIAVAAYSPRSRDPDSTPLDPVGAGLSLVGLGALVFAIIEGPERGWTAGLVVSGFIVAVAAGISFVMWERRSAHPMLPLRFFADRRFAIGSVVVVVVFFAMFGFFFLGAQYLQVARGYSPLLTGVAMLPLAAASVIVSPRSAGWAERYGTGPVVIASFAAIAAGFGVLAVITPDSSYLVLAAAFALLGAGLGAAAAPATGSIMSAVPLSKAGVGSAVNDTTRELGGALGIAVLGTIAASAYRSQVDVSGLSLPPEVLAAASESAGAAAGLAREIPGGDLLAARAAVALTDAFNLASAVSAAIAIAGAGFVAVSFSRRREREAVAAAERASLPPVAAAED